MSDKSIRESQFTPFKLFGLQRSGTNLLQYLIQLNFEVVSLEIGNEWKHGYISPDHYDWTCNSIPVRVFVCVKNPYAWLASCYNYFITNHGLDPTVDSHFSPGWSFCEFIRRPSYGFNNPIVRWNELNRHWAGFCNRCKYAELIVHERMLSAEGQRKVLTVVGKRQCLRQKAIAISTASMRIDTKCRILQQFDREYYLQQRYLALYPNLSLEFVNMYLDMRLMELFDYKPITF